MTEPRGKRAKRWIRDSVGHLWMRKEIRASRPFERCIEVSMLRLADAAGLAGVPESHLCRWQSATSEHIGVIVRSFVERGEQLGLGAEVIARQDPTFVPKDKHAHTLGRAMRSLRALQADTGAELVSPFTDILLFDAWIGLQDRHSENWGVVTTREGVARLAPIFDVSACLGAELDDQKALLIQTQRTEQLVQKYIERCPSGFGNGDRLLRQAELMEDAREVPEVLTRSRRLLPRFQAALTDFQAYVYTLQDEWLPPARRELAIELLASRLSWLREVLHE